MKVLAVNGSPRKDSNTGIMIDECVKELKRRGATVETVSLRDHVVRPCNACEACYKRPWKCPIKDDAVMLLKKMADADGILLGSPVYGADVTAQMKALLDRSIMPYNFQYLRNKVGGAIIVGGGAHGGQEYAILQLLSFFAFQGIIVANPEGGLFGAMATANDRGEVRKDKEGMKSARQLGTRMAELMRMAGK